MYRGVVVAQRSDHQAKRPHGRVVDGSQMREHVVHGLLTEGTELLVAAHARSMSMLTAKIDGHAQVVSTVLRAEAGRLKIGRPNRVDAPRPSQAEGDAEGQQRRGHEPARRPVPTSGLLLGRGWAVDCEEVVEAVPNQIPADPEEEQGQGGGEVGPPVGEGIPARADDPIAAKSEQTAPRGSAGEADKGEGRRQHHHPADIPGHQDDHRRDGVREQMAQQDPSAAQAQGPGPPARSPSASDAGCPG